MVPLADSKVTEIIGVVPDPQTGWLGVRAGDDLSAGASSAVKTRAALQLENVALRHQIGVLHRSAKKRPQLHAPDRLL
jgi:hypothetical protein